MVVKILEVLNTAFQWQAEELPSYNSIASWVQKSGYCVYDDTGADDFTEDYAAIVDESMMVGSEKLLLTVGIPAAKTTDTSLTEGEVKILNMSVNTSWNSASIGEVFAQVEEKMEAPPAYVISDNASTISKAVRDKGYTHLRDVGHTFGLFMQKIYEKAEVFQSLMDEISGVKFKEVMRPPAYLLPPKQRTIARFMNLSGTVKWAMALLQSFSRLSKDERKVFRFIKDKQAIIKELSGVFQVVNPVLQQLKNEGLSSSSAKECLSKIRPLLTSSKRRVAAVGKLIEEYLAKECSKLPDEQARCHISSDIIESLFGSYKARQSPNAMNGVTKQILLLPLRTRMKQKAGIDKGCFKLYLERVSLQDLATWRDDHLSENRTVKRRELLSA
jgi:hypothetical protein